MVGDDAPADSAAGTSNKMVHVTRRSKLDFGRTGGAIVFRANDRCGKWVQRKVVGVMAQERKNVDWAGGERRSERETENGGWYY